MNRKTLRIALLIAVALAAVAAAGALLAHRAEREWTTESEAALAQFQRGLDEAQRLYRGEAAGHFERAIELDPDFVAAKLLLLERLEGRENEPRRKSLEAELRAADLSRLSPRERFLIEHYFAVRDRDTERAAALLDDYLERHPDDPFALNTYCLRLWQMRDFAEAEALYRRLIEIDPNWVTAQNHLGYTAMAQGDWQRAEEQFEIYRYLAPDQANPHDSLGELMLLTGRWEEARREFEAALAIKPDFYASWGNLVMLELLNGRFEQAEQIIDGIERDGLATEEFIRHQRCRLGVWRAYGDADWRGVRDAYRAQCEPQGDAPVIAYEAALLAGLPDEAAALAEEMKGGLEQYAPSDAVRAVALHLEGIRLRVEGRPAEAVERLREADRLLVYFGRADGYFKLANRVQLWQALTAAGRMDEADRLLNELRAVNPTIAERWTSQISKQAVAGSAGAERPAS